MHERAYTFIDSFRITHSRETTRVYYFKMKALVKILLFALNLLGVCVAEKLFKPRSDF